MARPCWRLSRCSFSRDHGDGRPRRQETRRWIDGAVRFPAAHENDAERAARAGLSIQRALGDLNGKHLAAGRPELTARIGLETGPAVVDAAGEIYGDVANVAARVQALAEPGTVL